MLKENGILWIRTIFISLSRSKKFRISRLLQILKDAA